MNSGPMLSPEEAIQQVKQTLSTYIMDHPDPAMGWKLKAESGLELFNKEFPSDQKHSLDAIKKYVLETLAPTFVHFGKWLLWLPGASILRQDLEKNAHSWPSHQAYLEHALEQAQKALGEMQIGQQPASSSTEVVDEKSDKDDTKDKVAKLEAQLDNLRTVNVALVTRLKSQEAAANTASSVPAAQEKPDEGKARGKRSAKKL